MNVLNCHPDIRCLREPFNPDQAGNTYLGRVHDLGSLDVVLRHIWRGYNGVKHVWEPSGWPFGRGMGFNLAVTHQPIYTICLPCDLPIIRRPLPPHFPPPPAP